MRLEEPIDEYHKISLALRRAIDAWFDAKSREVNSWEPTEAPPLSEGASRRYQHPNKEK